MALDTLRAAVWPPSDVPLDRAGRRLPGWRDRLVCVELHYRRRDWWFRPGMAADRGGVVCAADGVPADCWPTVNANKKCEVAFFHLTFFYTIQIVWIILPHQKKDQHLKFHQIVQHILFYPHEVDISPKG